MSVAVTAPGRPLAHEHLRLVRERRTLAARLLVAAPWIALGLYFAVQVTISALGITGPFLDEGIYIAAGLRTLQGHGISDDYLSWFSGSLAWPVLAAVGWKAAGLAGARIVAAICVTLGLAGMLKATGNLFGTRVRATTALAAITSGPVIALGHLAVYDTLAVACAGGAFWAASEFLRRDNRAWLCGAAILYAGAGLAKYPVILFVGPPLLLMIATVRGRRRVMLDLGLFAFIASAILMVYFLSDRPQLTSFEAFRTVNNPNFHVTRGQIAYSQVYLTAVPLILAVAGAFLVSDRRLGLSLLTGVAGAPFYHLDTGNPSGDQKHVVFSLLFLLPLIGVTISHALSRWRMLIAIPALVGLFVFALVQEVRIDEGWPDLRGSAHVLVKQVHPGQRLLANSAWVEAAYLYSAKRISTPYDVYDVYRVEHLGHAIDVCDFQWFIEVPGGEPWPAKVRQQMHACGTFHRIYDSSSTITGLGSNLDFITYRAPIEIWKNEPVRSGTSSTAVGSPLQPTTVTDATE